METSKFILTILLILLFVMPGAGLVLKTGKDIFVGPEEIIDDDLIVMGQTVKIQGIVNGDVFAFAREVEIENVVNGSIYTGCAEVNIKTKNCRSIWAFCGSLKTEGNIENNLLFFGGTLKTANTNLVKKDIIAFGGEIDINGGVQGKVKGKMGELNLNGKIQGVDVETKETYVNSNATIMEDFIVRSKNEPVIDSNARILGKTEYKNIEEKTKKPKRLFPGLFKTIFFISKVIIGIILIALLMPYIKMTNEILKVSTYKSLGIGFLTIIVIPVAVVITIISIIGIPIGIFGLFVFLTLVYVSGIVFAAGFGEWIIKLIRKESTPSPIISFILGFIIITLIFLIPYLGFFARIVVFFFGTGMIAILIHKLHKNSLLIK